MAIVARLINAVQFVEENRNDENWIPTTPYTLYGKKRNNNYTFNNYPNNTNNRNKDNLYSTSDKLKLEEVGHTYMVQFLKLCVKIWCNKSVKERSKI